MRKWIFGIGVCVLWGLVVLLALESFAAFVLARTEMRNPWIVTHKAHQPPPPATYPPSEPVVADPAVYAAWKQRKVVQPEIPEWYEVPKDSCEERERAYPLFGGLSPQEKDAFALLHGVLILAFDSDGHQAGLFGDSIYAQQLRWFMDTWAGALVRKTMLRSAWNQGMGVVNEALRTHAPQRQDVPLPDGSVLHLSALPGPDARNAAFAFLYRSSDAIADKLPPDSRWEIAYFRLKKNYREEHPGEKCIFSTNDHGFRDRDFAIPKPKGVFRILCVGASTTEEGPNNDKTYPKLLEKKLNAHFGAGQIEVINCGTSGLTTRGHVARLADYLELEPDLVITYESVNDIQRELPAYWESSNVSCWRRIAKHSRFCCRYFSRAFFPAPEQIRANMRTLPLADLDVMRKVLARHNVPVVMCGLATPDYAHLESEQKDFFDYIARWQLGRPFDTCSQWCEFAELFNDELLKMCEREGVYYIPVGKHIGDGSRYFGDLCHMMDEGIDRKAETIFQYLRDYLPPLMDPTLPGATSAPRS